MKTAAEGKSAVLASSAAVWPGCHGPSTAFRTRSADEMDAQWRTGRLQDPKAVLPEEGLEPTRTYAQALLRRPRLPFRHSGVRCPASISEYARWELIRDVSV